MNEDFNPFEDSDSREFENSIKNGMDFAENIKKFEAEKKNYENGYINLKSPNRTKILQDYKGEDKIISSLELDHQFGQEEKTLRIDSGLLDLDNITEGVEVGELVVVTGPTGEGKTTLMMSITQNMAEKGTPTAWFTLEVTPKQFIQKIKSKNGNVPLFYLPAKNLSNTIQWLTDRITEAKLKYGVQVIFIDHIHGIFSLDKMAYARNISLEIGDIVAKIKQMAIEMNLVIYLVAHSRDATDNPRREPAKEDIRDSGLISRFADTIIGVWRIRNQDDNSTTRRPLDLSEEDCKGKIRVMKNRRTGKLGSFTAYVTNYSFNNKIEF